MALSVKEPSMKEKLALLSKLLPSEYMTPLHDKLVGGDIKLETKFYNLAFYWGDGYVVAANMPLSTPTLMDMSKDDPSLGASKFEMLKLYKELAEEYNKGHPIFPLPLVKATSYSDAMNHVPAGSDSKPKVKPLIKTFEDKYVAPPKAIKPATAAYDKAKLEEAQKILDGAKKTPFLSVEAPIKLKDATILGQRVKGTSPDAKYYLVAKGGGIRLAMRNLHKNGTVSFRVEFAKHLTTEEILNLQKAGLTMQKNANGPYGSIHLGTMNQNGEVLPLGRIAGSFMMGMGIEWEEMIMNPTDIPEDKP